MKKPLVSIITVNFDQTEATCALLNSIRHQDYGRVEVVVVDNGSRENPAKIFKTHYPEVKFIRSERNRGFAGGNNLALERASGDYLFFVNNDAELTEGCIERLLALFQEFPKLGIASPLICYPLEKPSALNPQPSTIIQYAGSTLIHPFTGRNRTIGNREVDIGQFADSHPTAYTHGAAMMLPRRVLELVGPMSEYFFLYYEELDWCERIRRAGYEVWVEPRARVYHKESLTVQKLGALKTYFLNRNRVCFMKRNYGGWRLGIFYLFLFLVTVPKNVLGCLFRGELENMKAFVQGVFWNFNFAPKNTFEMARTVKKSHPAVVPASVNS